MRKYYKNKRKKNYFEVLIVLGLLVFITRQYIENSFYAALIYGVVIIVALMIVAGPISKFVTARKRKKKYLKSNIQSIDSMTGVEFEEYLKAHFEKKGYKVENTPASNDYGADLILIKGGVKTVVQVKRYKGKIGNSAIQEVVGAAGYYKADKCMVITNSFFTVNAENLAKANNVELWDRYKLIDEFAVK